MLYKLASVFFFTAFFMAKNLTTFIEWAGSNMEQVAFIVAVEQANPSLSAAMGLQLFFPLLCLLLCLATASLATELAFWLFHISYLTLDFGIECGKRQYQKLSQSK